MSELSNQVQAAVAEIRSLNGHQPQGLPPAPASPWPLDGVVRLHSQLRDSGEGPSAPETAAPRADKPLALPETSGLTERIETLERDLSDRQAELTQAAEQSSRRSRLWRVALFLLLVGIGATAVFISRLHQQVNAAAERVTEAEQRSKEAAQAADRQVTAAKEDAAQQVAEAWESANRARTISDVLAAPDLVRYNLIGKNGPAISRAQLFWSRSRGMVFSGSRLPPPPPSSAYQIWLLTNGEPISAGVFVPDEAGRVTLATDEAPTVPRALTAVTVTVEPEGGGERPTGITLLARSE
jgi:hypothetical protein